MSPPIQPHPVRSCAQRKRLGSSSAESRPRGIGVDFRAFRDADPKEQRRLHGKGVLLESDDWIVSLVGSSNFTSAGLAISGVANIEANIAIGTRADSPTATQLRELFPAGD